MYACAIIGHRLIQFDEKDNYDAGVNWGLIITHGEVRHWVNERVV